MSSYRSAIQRLLPLVTAFAVALGPFAVSLHAVHHLEHLSAESYSAHDEAAHASHSAPEHHHLCGLCVHAKSSFVAATAAPGAFSAIARDDVPALPEQRSLPAALIAAAPPRAPPSIG